LKLPVRTAVVHLHPAADGRRPKATATVAVGERPVEVTLRVIALWESDAEALLADPHLGLLPFVPLARGGDDLARVERAVRAIQEQAAGTDRSELLAALFLLSGPRFPKATMLGIIRREDLMESSTYRDTIEFGERRVVMAMLNRRLGAAGAASLAARLEPCEEAMLMRIASLIVDTPDAERLLDELERLLPPVA
jgi:hypothetical protein